MRDCSPEWKQEACHGRSDMNPRVITSLRKVTCVLSAISVMSELSQRERRSTNKKRSKNKMMKLCAREMENSETFVPTHSSASPLQLPCLTSVPRCGLSCVSSPLASWPWKVSGWQPDRRTFAVVAFGEVAGAGRQCVEVELLLLLFNKKKNKTGGVSLPLPFLDLGGEKGKIKSGSKG